MLVSPPTGLRGVQAREGMRTKAATVAAAGGASAAPGAWKWDIRKRIWDYMEANDIAR